MFELAIVAALCGIGAVGVAQSVRTLLLHFCPDALVRKPFSCDLCMSVWGSVSCLLPVALLLWQWELLLFLPTSIGVADRIYVLTAGGESEIELPGVDDEAS